MKKKFMPIFVAVTMLTAGLVSCGNKPTPTTSNNPTTGAPTTTVTPTTSETPEPTTPTIVHVESVSITAEKTTLFVGDTTKTTVTVLPENANDKSYGFLTENDKVATVSGDGTITAVGAGTTNIVVKTSDGGKEGKVLITVNAASAPVINMPEQTTFTVAVGEALTLPTITAIDYRGNDITKDMDIADTFEKEAVSNGVFNARIAGTHTISYYITDDNGEDEQFLTVNVTPTHEETFDVGEYTDPAALKTYGVFKENFANGKRNKLSIADSQGAAKIDGGEDAISGNSLIIDAGKTAGSALYGIFINAFKDYFDRGRSATYKISFDYKILSNASGLRDFYCSISWDGSNGINNNFVNTSAAIGEVQHKDITFAGTVVPETGNAWFSFWKLGAGDARIAIDNLVFEAVEETQVTEVIPTSEQLLAEGGFTWNMKDKGAKISSGKAILVKDVEDEALKTKMQGSSLFTDTVMELTGADGHLFSGLTKDNLVVGKKATIKMNYVAENEKNLFFIMMKTDGHGATLSGAKVTDNEDGTRTLTWTGTIESGWCQLNIYGQNNPQFHLYIGSIEVSLTDADPIPEDTTPKGYKVGQTWTFDSRAFGLVDDANRAVANFDNNEDVLAETAMGTKPQKITFKAADQTIEWVQMGQNVMETGMTYKITMDYYVTESNGGSFSYRADGDFPAFGPSTVGYHHSEIDYVAKGNVDYFSFYSLPSGFVGTFYVNAVTVKLVALNK